MEIFQLDTRSWFQPRSNFLEDPTLSTRQQPIYCHILNGTMTSQHLHRTSLLHQQEELLLYRWRFEHSKNILPIYNIEMVEVIRTEAKISVLCQKLFFNVEDIFDKLMLTQQLYVFKEVIEMVKLLGSKFGWFKLGLRMFGLNKNGICRVWVNQNHASNMVQWPLDSQEKQFREVIALFRQFHLNQDFGEFLNEIKKIEANNCKYQTIVQILNNFLTRNSLILINRIDVDRIIKMSEEQGQYQYSEFQSRPSFTFKQTKQSTEVSKSGKQYSVNSKDSIVPSFQSIQSNSDFKYKLKIPRRKKRLTSLTPPTVKQLKPVLSHLQTKTFLKAEEMESSPTHSLGYQSNLQESIIIESDTEQPHKPSFDINQLQKLGRIGKFCQSLTPQQLILQEFKDIYE